MPQPHLPLRPRGQLTYFWHWLGTRKRLHLLLFTNSDPVILEDMISPLRCLQRQFTCYGHNNLSVCVLSNTVRHHDETVTILVTFNTIYSTYPSLMPLILCIFAGSFHLIHLMFDDYVLYLLESLHCQERANDLMRAMKGEGSTGENPTWRSLH